MEPNELRPVLAVDLGGTQLRAAYVGPDLDLELREAEATRDEEGVEAVIGRLCRLAQRVRARAEDAGLPAPVGVGISSPGPINPWTGYVVIAPNLRGWRDIPLADTVQRELGLPTFLERDTNVAVLAEWQHGSARGARNVIYATISTGIGGGIVLDGRPVIGPDGTAGEIGHSTVDLDGPFCGDGQQGHAEAIGSGTAIARDGAALLASGGSEALARLAGGDPTQVTAELVARAAEEGDLACAAIMQRAFEAVGALCAGLVNVLNPEVIVLGGSIARHQPGLFTVVRSEIDARSFRVPAQRVRLVESQFGDDVSLVGSLTVVNDRLDDPAYRRPAGKVGKR